MKERNWIVKITDPIVEKYFWPILPINQALKEIDAAILVTDHQYFKNYNFKKFPIPLIFDARNFLTIDQLHPKTKLITFGFSRGD